MPNIEDLLTKINQRLDAINEQYDAVNGYLNALTTSIDTNSADITNIKERLLQLEAQVISLDEFETLKNDVKKLYEIIG